ncbi:hypothetical protein Kpol_1063p22 [Vanderwaltozyma polyspora DSM 70294]|uniref:Peptidase A1 domain-containing protein n=1 Tax=Vanderwaltozyma polyspora (strain ATCC 22028 / DSM 70294 / BCRC 21397 / CBS 2163 / NBRC 10782 / NRRL Y-8283 / UCD 57-17) TaxID=436907 RepID=A7TQR6_VANPO|nr:uncharacterized protein Kpol_1063p22 [Vanderwaltozyma polyspora DSM 70294]EDO15411.1 hypothetical protein Kpol_1063p22 [Vanderwaltozyma polyspora DSM 70294]
MFNRLSKIYTLILILAFLHRLAISIPIISSENNFRSSNNNVHYSRSYDNHNYLELDIQYHYGQFYSTLLSFGNPVQNVTVLVDTGSSDLWVSSPNNIYCYEDGKNTNINHSINCTKFGTYTRDKSSTSNKLDHRLFIQYGDGSFADGEWITDTLTIGPYDLQSVQFGISNNASTIISGVLGLGFLRTESIDGYDGSPNKLYYNLPAYLKDQEITNTNAFSLFLNNSNDASGTVLFGGIDYSKFSGDLVTFPLVNIYPKLINEPCTFTITLQQLYGKINGGKSIGLIKEKVPALLDSGSSLISMPIEITDEIALMVNSTLDTMTSLHNINCSAFGRQ